MKALLKALSAAVLTLGLAVTSAQANTVVNSFDNGWYDNFGSHSPSNNNIIVGGPNSSIDYNNFFAFDFTGLSLGTVSSAVLTVFGSNGNFGSGDPTETYVVYDVITDITTLLNGVGGNAAFTDLGSGTSYGSTVIVSPGQNLPMPPLTINLNGAALADINAALLSADKRFAIGGDSTTLTGNQRLWTFSGTTPAAALTLSDTPIMAAIPLPAAGWLLFAGIGGLVVVRRRPERA